MNAFELSVSGIKCDAHGCTYRDETITLECYQQWLNKPCPRCGANLLTQTDLDASLGLVQFAEVVNAVVGQVQEGAPTEVFSITMDGHGIRKIERVKKS